MLIAMVRECHSWAGLLVASLLWKLALYLPVPGKLILREEAFESDPA